MDGVRISVVPGGVGEAADDLRALAEWLDQESDMRGMIKLEPAVPGRGELGALATGLEAAVGSGGALTVLAGSLKVFFSQPRGAKVRIVVHRADGSSVQLDADRVRRAAVPELARQLLGTEGGDPPAGR